MKNDTIEKIRKDRDYLSSEFGVEKIGLFGSVATGTDNDSSDIDLIVEFSRPLGFKFIRLVEYLEGILGRKVDLLTQAGLENIRVRKVADDIRKTLIYV
ncbi:MAG: nucleotidyltransferase [Syntrophus sp. (in: bacteria)]|nr:nucleotidyltransferase [Syntrophus sp. (in: bacteria)]